MANKKQEKRVYSFVSRHFSCSVFPDSNIKMIGTLFTIDKNNAIGLSETVCFYRLVKFSSPSVSLLTLWQCLFYECSLTKLDLNQCIDLN